MESRYTNEEVVDIIESEGLDYAIQHYMGSEAIKDPKTAELWDAAEKALNGLVDHLKKETGREDI